MSPEFIIDVHGLSKSFAGKPAVKNLSLRIRKGEIFGFLGPNGSGKTTTMRMLCGLLTPDSGSGYCLNYNVLTESREIKKRVGYIPQTFSLYKDLTVKENLEFVARAYEMEHPKQCVENILHELLLTPYQHQLAQGLSGGWKQRLSLGAALIHKPHLLLLDEPTAGVDPKARRDFWNDIHKLSEQGISSLVSTHYMEEAERCHRLLYMMQGTLLIEGSISEIMQKTHLKTLEEVFIHLVEEHSR